MENTAYKIIAEVNKLNHLHDNIFSNQKGQHLYLDKYGFHNVVQMSNILITEREDELNKKEAEFNKGFTNHPVNKFLLVVSSIGALTTGGNKLLNALPADKFPSLSTKAIGLTGALDHLIDLIYITKLASKLHQAEKFEVDRPKVWKPYV